MGAVLSFPPSFSHSFYFFLCTHARNHARSHTHALCLSILIHAHSHSSALMIHAHTLSRIEAKVKKRKDWNGTDLFFFLVFSRSFEPPKKFSLGRRLPNRPRPNFFGLISFYQNLIFFEIEATTNLHLDAKPTYLLDNPFLYFSHPQAVDISQIRHFLLAPRLMLRQVLLPVQWLVPHFFPLTSFSRLSTSK